MTKAVEQPRPASQIDIGRIEGRRVFYNNKALSIMQNLCWLQNLHDLAPILKKCHGFSVRIQEKSLNLKSISTRLRNLLFYSLPTRKSFHRV